MSDMQNCPCQPQRPYADCCRPFHVQNKFPATAEELMRSRYSAYVLQKIDYIVETTVPSQQNLLNQADMSAWSRETEWLGLDVLQHMPNIGKQHAQVAFTAHFREAGGKTQHHHELSAFVKINSRWYFIDPTVPLPAMKQPCICGSGKKFKACCGQFFK
ncbi:YchJ family protein [Neisseria sp. CCUG12390]|uniref:YchJ family protein n=1 Tax=Neisseria sp. CCUG12390 TaxID=3392035 RepID=UPI003A0FEA47